MIAHVLRCDFELTADMILDQLQEKFIVVIRHHVIIAQARTHKHLLDAGNFPQLTQQLEIVRMICAQIAAGLREQTALILT